MNAWDLIVIGAGAVGSAALRAASEAGARVLGLERFAPAHRRGSSHGLSRIYRHAYFEHPDYVPLLRHSSARFASLERESGTSLRHRCGMLLMGATRLRRWCAARSTPQPAGNSTSPPSMRGPCASDSRGST